MEKIKNLDVKEQLIRKFENIYTDIHNDSVEASKYIAHEIADLIKSKAAENQNCVLGLATGSSPVKIYNELVRLHQEEGLSFKNVITFNLDEYYPMPPENMQSYVYFMHHHLFNHIDIPKENIHIPDGNLAESEINVFCQSYEEKIKQYGGLDVQILGIGRTGHVGFNEPGSGLNSITRLITLDHLTKSDAASDFGLLENVPQQAITMGVQTIMSAKRIFLMAWGEKKAQIIQQTVEGTVSESIPATFLQKHSNVEFVIDRAAASDLKREKYPWLFGECEWDESLTRKASIWLCHHLKKPILKLSNHDYKENGLAGLLAESGNAEHINTKVFNYLKSKFREIGLAEYHVVRIFSNFDA